MRMEDRKLPEGWKWVKMGTVCDVIAGQSPPGETYMKSPEGLPFFQGKADFGVRYPIARTWCVSPVKIALPNDILISVRAPVGPTNVANVKCCIGRGLAAIRCGSSSDFDYILWTLKFHEKQLASLGSGSTFAAINRSDLENLNIPLPPLPEQKRIAAILTEQMAAVEKARAAAEAQLEAAKALPSAYLKKVFPQKGQELPEGWKWVKLGDVCSFKRGPFGGALKKEIFVKEGYKVYEQSHAIKNDFTIGSYFINDNKFREMISFATQPSDLIISCSGTMGKVAIVSYAAQPGIINQALLRLRPQLPICVPEYLRDYLQSDYVQIRYFRMTAGAAIQNVAPVSVLKDMPIPLPPLPEQKRIAAMLNEQMTEAERLRKAIEDQLKEIKAMPAALLRKAFNGEL